MIAVCKKVFAAHAKGESGRHRRRGSPAAEKSSFPFSRILGKFTTCMPLWIPDLGAFVALALCGHVLSGWGVDLNRISPPFNFPSPPSRFRQKPLDCCTQARACSVCCLLIWQQHSPAAGLGVSFECYSRQPERQNDNIMSLYAFS